MPRGLVIVRIEDKLNEKDGAEADAQVRVRGNLKKMKLSTHFTAGSSLWNFRRSKVASTTQPSMPPAVANPSTATCCM